MNRVFIILKEDIIHYPPVLTILNVLPKIGIQPIHIGVYSDEVRKTQYEKNGVIFVPTDPYYASDSLLIKLKKQIRFRNTVKHTLEASKITDDDRVWIMQSETICLLSSIVECYPTILHFFEYVEPKINWKYKVLNPSYNPARTLNKARKIVCCEYNRAQITKGIFQLKNLPIVLPNKVMVDEEELKTIPSDIRPLVDFVIKKTSGKKVILYQGIFLDEERRLEEFCEAVNQMSDDYSFIAMGKGSELYERLKRKYESERILFIPFIRPPYHLIITKLASIGVLSYFPRRGPIAYTINPIYCAPNKIFEYARFGVPMISNDIPALKYAFLEFNCGECIPYPMTTVNISDTILKVMNNLDYYKEGARRYFESVDIEQILKEVLE